MPKRGKVLVAAEYDRIEPFSDGFAVVELERTYGFISVSGEEVVRPLYESTGGF